MIRTFRNKALAELWRTGASAKIDARFYGRIFRRLDRLDACEQVQEMSIAGFRSHRLIGPKPQRYTVHVNGPWCITFEFVDGHAENVDFEQYH